MNIPDFIKKGDIIGVTAPSAGFTEEVDLRKLESAKHVRRNFFHL